MFEPMDCGAVQVTVTFVPLIAVTGGVGVDGTYAAKTEIVVELVENPQLVLAQTLNEYVEPIVNYEIVYDVVVKPDILITQFPEP